MRLGGSRHLKRRWTQVERRHGHLAAAVGDVVDQVQEAGCPIPGLTVLGYFVRDRSMILGSDVSLVQTVAQLMQLTDSRQSRLQHERQHQADDGQPVQKLAAVAGGWRHLLDLDSERALRASDRISRASLITYRPIRVPIT